MSEAEQRRDIGMARAQARAEREISDWTESAALFVKSFAEENRGVKFLAEQVRASAIVRGFPQPSNLKAWGPAILAAKKAGYIVPCGYGPAASSNCSPKVCWRAP